MTTTTTLSILIILSIVQFILFFYLNWKPARKKIPMINPNSMNFSDSGDGTKKVYGVGVAYENTEGGITNTSFLLVDESKKGASDKAINALLNNPQNNIKGNINISLAEMPPEWTYNDIEDNQ